MTYLLRRDLRSPNHYAQRMPLPIRHVVLHWWGNPSGQNPYGVISWLSRPGGASSCNAVVWPGNVAVIVDWQTPAWASGSYQINTTSISLECDPNDIPGTMTTTIELLADLVRQGTLAPDFRLTGHRDHQSTECPGAYYSWLPTIRQRVTDALANQTDQEDEMTPDQNAKLLDIWWRLTQPEGLATIANTVLDTEVPRGGMEGTELDGPTTLRAELSWLTSAQARMINALDALEERLAALEGGGK